MKRSLFLTKLWSARILSERFREMLQRSASDRGLVVIVSATMIVVVWSLLALGRRVSDVESAELQVSSYRPPDARTAACYHQSLEKARLAREVLDERCTFDDAVAAFRSLHARNPHVPSLARFLPVGCTEEEALRWNVAAFLRSALHERPEKASQVERIEREISRVSEMRGER